MVTGELGPLYYTWERFMKSGLLFKSTLAMKFEFKISKWP